MSINSIMEGALESISIYWGIMPFFVAARMIF